MTRELRPGTSSAQTAAAYSTCNRYPQACGGNGPHPPPEARTPPAAARTTPARTRTPVPADARGQRTRTGHTMRNAAVPAQAAHRGLPSQPAPGPSRTQPGGPHPASPPETTERQEDGQAPAARRFPPGM